MSEKDLEDYIFKDLIHNNGNKLRANGLTIPRIKNGFKWLRQFDLGSYGRTDIIGLCRSNGTCHLFIMELKTVPLRSGDFDQVLRYKTAFDYIFREKFSKMRYIIYPILIGPCIHNGNHIYFNDQNITVFAHDFDGDKINFFQISRRLADCDRYVKFGFSREDIINFLKNG